MISHGLKKGDVLHVKATQRDGKKFYICLSPPTDSRVGRFLYTNSKKVKRHRGDYEVNSNDLGIRERDPTSIVSFSSVAVLTKAWIDDPTNGASIVGSVRHIARELGREAGYHREKVSDDDADLIGRTFRELAASHVPPVTSPRGISFDPGGTPQPI